MKLGILKTGSPPPGVRHFGTYPDMFRTLLGPDRYHYAVYDAEAGELPGQPDACDAYILTGSPASAYDDLLWIADLKKFLKAAKGKAALVGICFGHQLMAETFGGKVARASDWGVGAHRYDVVQPQPWIGGVNSFCLPASHRDQVVKAPPAAEVIARSAFSPFGMLAYRDQPAISLQLHPEFTPDFAAAMLKDSTAKSLNSAEVDAALASLEGPLDRDAAANWIHDFLESAVGR